MPQMPPEWEIAQARLALTARQQRIAADLGSRSPVLREWFLYGLVLIRRRTPEGWEHLLGHTGRELMNRLPDYFPEVPESGGRVSYENCMDALAAEFPDGMPDGATLSGATRRQLNRLLERHRSSREARREREAAFLAGSARGDTLPTEDELDWLRQQWKDVHTAMVRAAHLRDPGDALPDADELMAAYGRLQDLLTSRLLEVPFGELDEEARELARISDPTPADLLRARALLREQLQPGFFAEATAAWLPLLEGAGMLAQPPAPIIDGDWVRFPIWPAAEYLTRVAADSPDDVLRVIDAMQDTDNIRVLAELARALANMPDRYALGNTQRIARWLEDRSTHRLLLPQVAEEYLRRLTDRDRPEALSFAQALLATRAETRDYGAVAGDPTRRWVDVEIEPERMDRHHYETLLRNTLPRLAERRALSTAKLLIDQLDTANAQIRSAIGSNASAHAEWSLWRRAIEPHPDEFVLGGVRGRLVDAIRDLGESLIERDQDEAREFLGHLSSRGSGIFDRLRLHLLRISGSERFRDLRREAVLDRDRMDSAEEWHEYALLLADTFAQLSDAERDLYLSWVEDGGSTNYLEQQYADRQGGEVPPDLRDRWIDRRRLQWLSPIKHELAEPWRSRYEALVAQFRELEQGEFIQSFPHAGDSLLTAAELNDMPVAAAVQSFSGAGSPEMLDDHALEQLGEEFEQAVVEQPARWAVEADRFINSVEPVYIHQLLEGLSRATNDRKKIPWEAVITLGEHVVTQSTPDAVLTRFEGDRQAEMCLARVRSMLARLLADAARDADLRSDCENRLWQLLVALLDDPSPTPAEEAGDVVTAAIGSTRGQAMQGVIRYCALKMTRVRRTDPTATLAALPNVKAVLEQRLDPATEPSRAVRFMYATGLGVLAWVDRAWLASQIPRIFPVNDEAMRDSAWDSYIRWTNYRADVVELLGSEYERAVKAVVAGSQPADGDDPAAGVQLGVERQHLARDIYIADWCRSAALVTAVREFQARAPATDRAAGVTFIGYGLHNEDAGKPFRDDLNGLRRVWAGRLAALPDGDPELAAFGTWFASGCLTDHEDLDRLAGTARRAAGDLADVYDVLAVLIDCGRTEPQASFEAISEIAQEPTAELMFAADRIEDALAAILTTASTELREQVAQLIDHLEWRGFSGLSRVLETANERPASGGS